MKKSERIYVIEYTKMIDGVNIEEKNKVILRSFDCSKKLFVLKRKVKERVVALLHLLFFWIEYSYIYVT
jgi:hypothetical protein